MSLPRFNPAGDLPPGVPRATMAEVLERFGHGTRVRRLVALRLERVHGFASETGAVRRFVVFGSFVTTEPEPNDVDVFMVMEDNFDVSETAGEARLLFEHAPAQTHFGASVFWLRRLAALDGEDAAVSQWQIKRDGSERGIVEIVEER